MSEVIAGLTVPETAAVAEASRLLQETTSPLIYRHSRRVFFFARMHAQRIGVNPDPELLYLAAMFHDVGLGTPFSEGSRTGSRPPPPTPCGPRSPCTRRREFPAGWARKSRPSTSAY
jgi:hypothetical protein